METTITFEISLICLFTMIVFCLGQLQVRTPELQIFQTGEDAIFSCTYVPSDATDVDITWFKGDIFSESHNLIERSKVIDGRASLLNARTGDASMQLASYSSADEGVYTCKVFGNVNGNGDQDQKTTVITTKQNEIPIIEISSSDNLLEGTLATLICATNSDPDSTILWYRDNKLLPIGGKYQIDGHVLNITTLSNIDHAWFKCQVKNNAGTFMSDAKILSVKYTPIPMLLFNGDLVTCLGEDANPPPISYVIYFDGVQQPVTNENKAKLKQNTCDVNITCFVKNAVGTGSDMEIFCPQDINPPEKQTGLERGAVAGILIGVTLVCTVVGVLIFLVVTGKITFKHGEFPVQDTGEKCDWPESFDAEPGVSSKHQDFDSSNSNWI
ncbi:neuronal cell adhesion molecule-like [Anneissia japonica]|uniref:neuronal cell adhesion molecule-like n=1 Tax=Anneissia japonica TaxID=1529436 RepID=UPI00142568B2|nr:neuronal cell adhesion molecule-like [Anneissia japonica]